LENIHIKLKNNQQQAEEQMEKVQNTETENKKPGYSQHPKFKLGDKLLLDT
jgi:hypothetical protein